MKLLLFFLLLGIAVFVEGVYWQIPITLIFLLIFFIQTRSNGIFFSAFVAGLVVDVLRVDLIGLRSMFLILFLFVVALYERKFEIRSLPFVFTASVLGSSLYLLIFVF